LKLSGLWRRDGAGFVRTSTEAGEWRAAGEQRDEFRRRNGVE
jgi:hypothetical protein